MMTVPLQSCHMCVMKMLHTALIAGTIAVGVTPAAFADQAQSVDTSAYVRAGLRPVAAEAPQYPVRSEAARAEGVCTVRFDIAADGGVTDAEPVACSSWDFEREALRVVASLRYPERAGGAVIENQEITFRWMGEE